MRIPFLKKSDKTSNDSINEKGEVFYDVSMRRLDEQLERREVYAARVGSVLVVGAAILPITIGLLTVEERSIPMCATVILWVSVVAFGLLTGSSLAVLLPANLDVRPDMATLEEYSGSYNQEQLRRWVAKECIRSIQENDPRLNIIASYVTAAVSLLAIETVSLAVAALLIVS